MTTTHSSPADSTIISDHEEIAKQAHKLWTEAGEPQGRDEEFWLEAEHYWWWHLNEQQSDAPTTAVSALSELLHEPQSTRRSFGQGFTSTRKKSA